MNKDFLLEDEEIISSISNKIYLTKNRVIEFISEWDKTQLKDIGINHIHKTSYKNKYNFSYLLGGLLLFLFGFGFPLFLPLRILKGSKGIMFTIICSTFGIIFFLLGARKNQEYTIYSIDGTKIKLPSSSESMNFIKQIRKLQN